MKNHYEHDLTGLEQMLEQIRTAECDSGSLSLEDILDIVGRRSFGPLLMLAGIATLAPVIGDIPGVPTAIAIFVIIVAVQVLFQQEHLWLPGWLLRRTVSQQKLLKAVDWMKRPARFVDRFLRPRLTGFVRGAGIYIIVIASMLVAIAMPVMEIVPFSANAAGLVMTVFGIALVANDGLFAIAGLTITAFIAAGVVWYLL